MAALTTPWTAGAVVGDHAERGTGYVYTEADWNLRAHQEYLPYHFSKKLAEDEARAAAAQQDRWDLVTILPSVVQGPPLGEPPLEPGKPVFA